MPIPALLAALLAPLLAGHVHDCLATPADDPAPLLIVACGDSTTAPRQSIGRVYAARLARRLGEGGIAAEVVNAGVGRDTTARARERFAADVLAFAPDLVVLQFGLNDSATSPPKEPTTLRVPLAQYVANLESMIAELRARGIAVLLMTPNPRMWSDHTKELYGGYFDAADRWGFDRHNRDCAAAVRDLASKHHVPVVDVHRLFTDFDAAEDHTLDELLLDGMHPNAEGHRRIAEALAERIAAMVAATEVTARFPRVPELADVPDLVVVEDGKARDVRFVGDPWAESEDGLTGSGGGRELLAAFGVGPGDFHASLRLSLESFGDSAAALRLGNNYFGFDGRGEELYLTGPLFGGVRGRLIASAHDYLTAGADFTLEVERAGSLVRFRIDGETAWAARGTGPFSRLGLVPARGTLRVRDFRLRASLLESDVPAQAYYTIPIVDVSNDTSRVVVVDREPGQYLGHPTTVLLEDQRTMIAVYPKGHGRGAIVMKRSTDAGLTWSERLPVPESWATSKEVPTIHRVVDKAGVKRLILFSGLYPIRMSVSEDYGQSWSELAPIGDFGGIVAMGCVIPLADGDYLALFHDDGRFFRADGVRTDQMHVYATRSSDGGLTWGEPRIIAHHPEAQLCEPGFLRSPDGKTIAVLLRENSRQFNSFVIFSRDEGLTWSKPRQLPAALTGDRHVARYAPDGRIFVTFRDTARESETQGDWCGWVGEWKDIVEGTEGWFRVRLQDNWHEWDCAYPGLELLPDGTFVATTYGHWSELDEPYIISVRFKLEELDAIARADPSFPIRGRNWR